MKEFIIVLFIILQTNYLFSQQWEHIFGTTNSKETLYDVIECYDKGYLMSGSYKIPSPSNWLLKTNINGELLWDKVILHETYKVFSGSVDQNSSGEIVLARCFSGGDFISTWPSVIKLDACGNKLWCRVFKDDNFMWGTLKDVIIFDNGDVLALGGLQPYNGDYTDQLFLYYINSEGNLLWRKSYASKNDHPFAMKKFGNGVHRFGNEYIITGDCYYPHPDYPEKGYYRPFFIGVDSLFEEKWILPFGVYDNFIGIANNVIQLNDSVYMGVGYKYGDGDYVITPLMFFNNKGEELGFNEIQNEAIGTGVNYNITLDIARLNDSLFITSTTYGPEQGLFSYGELIIDTAANIYKATSRPKTKGNSKMVKTFDNKYVIGCNYKHSDSNYDIYLYKINENLEFDTVYPGNYTYDSLCPYTIESGIVDVSDCSIIVGVEDIPTPKEYFAGLKEIGIKAYPNPATKGEITFAYQNTEHHRFMELKCYNIMGEMVHKEKVYRHQGESRVNVRSWLSGIYVALVFSNGQVVGQVKFIVE